MPGQLSRREFLKNVLLAAGGVALGGCRQGQGRANQITILHVNDFHGALYSRSGEGGAAHLIGLIERARAGATGPTLLLDAGDAFQGTYISNSNRGQAVVELMNLASVDAFVLGNHEFDWGQDVLQERIAQAQFPCLAANLETESGGQVNGVQPYALIEASDLVVGVLGLTYHDLATIVKASAIRGLRSLPPTQTVRRYLRELQEQADLVIVLSHMGLEADRALARAVPEIPIIVGGHSHVAIRSGERAGDTLIVQAGAYGEYLGHVEVTIDRKGKQIELRDATASLTEVTGTGAPSAEAEAIVAKWNEEAKKVGSQVIGETAIPLETRQGQETPLGNLITDGMRSADLGDGRDLEVAIHNDGGIRADLKAGPITYADIYAVLPFDNALVGLDLTGAQLRELLEACVSDQGTTIQVSGMQFTYAAGRPQGKRVVAATVAGSDLVPARAYRVVTIDYMHTNPKYEPLGSGTNAITGGLCLDAVIDHISAHSPVAPQVEGRMRPA